MTLAFSTTESTVHEVATRFLSDPVEKRKLTMAYDALITCCLSHQNHETVNLCRNILILCDLYRSLIVTALLLRLKYSHSQDTCRCLEDSVERSFLLLQILVGAPSSQDLVLRVPQSSYPLLNLLLEEPLLPLLREERKEYWSDILSDDESDHEEVGVGIPDLEQLAIQEQQLIEMAQRPIPESGNWKEATNDIFQVKHFQHTLLYPHDILMEDHNCKLFRCGLLEFDRSSIVLSSQTVVNVGENVIQLQVDTGTYASVPISTSKSADWIEAFRTAIHHKIIQESLRQETMCLWQ